MKKWFTVLLTVALMLSFAVASAAGKYVYYLDAEGAITYTKKDVQKMVKDIQAKMPADCVLTDDDNFYVTMDNLRMDRQESLMKHLKANYPAFEALSGMSKCKLTEDVLFEGMNGYNYDGVVVVQIIPVTQGYTMQDDVSKLFGFGGIKTAADMDVAIRVYDKAKNRYVFNYSESITEKISGTWSPVTASKKVIPIILSRLNNIDAD